MLSDGNPALDVSDLALVLIDLQADLVLGPDGVPHGWAAGAVHSSRAAAQWARSRGIPVVWVVVERRADYRDVAEHITQLPRPAAAARKLISGTPGAAIAPQLGVSDEDSIIVKGRISAFHGTGLSQLLRLWSRQTLIVGGVYTHFAVEATVRAAYDSDFDCIVLTDCCAAPSARAHATSLDVLPAFARLSSVAGLSGLSTDPAIS